MNLHTNPPSSQPNSSSFRFWDLANKQHVDRKVFGRLVAERLDKRKIISNPEEFAAFFHFYNMHGGYFHHPDLPQSVRETAAHLHGRLENTKDGSPVIAVKLEGLYVGLAFVLQYNFDRGPISWQEMTRSGLFNNDDAQCGQRLACPQIISASKDDTVRVKLMEELTDYALTIYPRPAKEFKVWVAENETENCMFHSYHAELDGTARQFGLVASATSGQVMRVYDYTQTLKLLGDPLLP